MDRLLPRFYVASQGTLTPPVEAQSDSSERAAPSTYWTASLGADPAKITATADGVSVDHQRLRAGESAPLTHRSLIVDPDRQAFVYLDRDDPALRLVEDLRRFTIALLIRGAEETRTQGLPLQESDSFPALPGQIGLAAGTNLLGRDPSAEIVLSSPMVSRRHAAVQWDGRKAVLTDLQSYHGTFRDGERLSRSVELAVGDRIDIGPFRLIFGGDHFVPAVDGAAEVTIDGDSFVAPTANGDKTILRDVHLAIRPREFVAIIGSSGCGKSILTKIAAGRLLPTGGGVYLDRESLHANFEAFQRRIAYVPQRDVLHESLTLDQTLDYAVRLRMPEDLTDTERKSEIDRVLQQVGLREHRATLVGRLSGGQARRASLAIELLSRPQFLLLDEATTGLDEEIDGEMMGLFRGLADSGVTVVCVTHHLGNIAKQCDRVAILTPASAPGGGGQLAFFGVPVEALDYFSVGSLAEIYPKLRDPSAPSWSATFTASDTYDRQVRQRTPLMLSNRARSGAALHSSHRRGLAVILQQTWLLLCRSLLVKRGQWNWAALMAAQAVGLAIMLSWLFGNLTQVQLTADEEATLQKVCRRTLGELVTAGEAARIQAMIPAKTIADKRDKAEGRLRGQWVAQKKGSLLLRLTVSIVMCALWLGCNNASSEIVRERSLFEAEREVGVKPLAYLGSKIALIGTVVIGQATVLLLGIRWGTGYPGPLLAQLALLGATASVGVAIGLAISAWAKSAEVSTALVPIAIIPQILLAGTLVPLVGEKQFLANWLAPLHWSYRGLVHLLQFTSEERELLALVGALPAYPESDGIRAIVTLACQGGLFLLLAWVGLVGAGRIHLPRRRVRA